MKRLEAIVMYYGNLLAALILKDNLCIAIPFGILAGLSLYQYVKCKD